MGVSGFEPQNYSEVAFLIFLGKETKYDYSR
jgi:hypothetical protein